MSAEAEHTDKLVGEILANRYQIEHRLGEGAMGTVYRARHIKVGRPFAVKVLHPRLLVDDKVLQRFEREAELAGRLHHPNVIGVVDVGETTDGLRYMVMDFAEGPDLSALLAEAPMPPDRIIHLVRQLLEGLYHAHEAGLIHRDFKPENVIVEKDTHGDEVPRIVDFGIAILREGGDSSSGAGRLTTNGLVLGTPHYMAPEQAVNDPIDHRIDLFALGIMIYEMLSGRLPFDGSGAEVARANLLLDPPPISERVPYLEVDPLLEAFARRLMAKKRDGRPPTAKVARDLLELVAKDRGAAAAALGVALDTIVPRSTQPVEPPRMSVPVALDEGRIATQPAEPLPFEVPAPRTHRMPIVAVAVAVIVLAIGVVIVKHRAGATDASKPDVGSNVVATADPVQPEVSPQITHDDPPPAVAVDARVDVKPTIKKPDRVKPAEVVKPPAVVETPPDVVTHVDDVTAFRNEFQAVGAELKVAARTIDVADLQGMYSRITFGAAVATQATRDAARGVLAQIRKDLASRKK